MLKSRCRECASHAYIMQNHQQNHNRHGAFYTSLVGNIVHDAAHAARYALIYIDSTAETPTLNHSNRNTRAPSQMLCFCHESGKATFHPASADCLLVAIARDIHNIPFFLPSRRLAGAWKCMLHSFRRYCRRLLLRHRAKLVSLRCEFLC